MAKKNDDEPFLWVLGLGAAGVVLYLLLRKKEGPGETITAPIAPIQAGELTSLGAINTRFGQIRELYRMGRLSPDEAQVQLAQLDITIDDLVRRRLADPASAQQVKAAIQVQIREIEEYKALVGSPA